MIIVMCYINFRFKSIFKNNRLLNCYDLDLKECAITRTYGCLPNNRMVYSYHLFIVYYLPGLLLYVLCLLSHLILQIFLWGIHYYYALYFIGKYIEKIL